ncbi:MAG: hypothetical protein ACRCYM_04270 [Cetobacterium sp.]
MIQNLIKKILIILNLVLEIIYNVLNKFLTLYYILFIFGLILSIKNKTVNLESIIFSTVFLISTQIYCKYYQRIKLLLEKNNIKR